MFKKTSGEIPPACLFITFFLALRLSLFVMTRQRRAGQQTQFVCPTSWTPPAGQEQVNSSNFPRSLPGTQPNYPILKLFIFYEVPPPWGIEILISGSKFPIIRLKSQTRGKN